MFGQRNAKRFDVEFKFARNNICRKVDCFTIDEPRYHCCIVNSRMIAQYCLYCGGLHTIASYLTLAITASDELYRAGERVTTNVSSTIDPIFRIRAVRIYLEASSTR